MPTQLIKKHIEEFASKLRNLPTYDDFEYGTEPIPGDRTWAAFAVVLRSSKISTSFKTP